MKFFQATHDYPHSWDKVTSAVWKKYPNEKAAHVVAVDVLNQWVDPETGILTVERLITCKQSVPALIKRIFNTDDVTHAREVVTVDPKTLEFEAKTVNLSFTNIVAIEETCKYTPNLKDHSTIFEQYAQIAVVGKLWRLTDYVEDFSLNRFKDNAAIGREAMHLVLERLFGATTAAASL